MSLTVSHLTADTTFLLGFSPPFAPPTYRRDFPGAFTILVDPWLGGSSSFLHPIFQITHHTVEPAIQSLDQLDGLDLIIITQDKPDHCHQKTLCSLPAETKVRILATPAAAKKIRKWRYFKHADTIQVMQPYSPLRPETITRIPLDAYSSGSADGELTITNIPSKWDVAGVHNAIGITYCPPGTVLQSADLGSTVNLHEMPMMGRHRSKRASTNKSPPLAKSPLSLADIIALPVLPPTPTDLSDTSSQASPISRVDSTIPRPSTSGSRAPSSAHSATKRQDNYEKVLSVIYTPHGILPATLQPYISAHLAPLRGALPLTALFHCLTVESNPKLMGGLVNFGAPGAVEYLREIETKYWIGAHDEAKSNSGWSTAWLETRRYPVEEVQGMLREASGGEGRKMAELCVLECGEERRFEG